MGDDGKSKHPDRVRDRSSVTTAVGAKDATPFLALQGRVRVVVGELFPMLAVYLAWNSPGWTEGRAEGRAFPPTDTDPSADPTSAQLSRGEPTKETEHGATRSQVRRLLRQTRALTGSDVA